MQTEEHAAADQLRRDYVDKEKYCPGKIAEILARREWE
jgi:hypothetical protein